MNIVMNKRTKRHFNPSYFESKVFIHILQSILPIYYHYFNFATRAENYNKKNICAFVKMLKLQKHWTCTVSGQMIWNSINNFAKSHTHSKARISQINYYYYSNDRDYYIWLNILCYFMDKIINMQLITHSELKLFTCKLKLQCQSTKK